MRDTADDVDGTDPVRTNAPDPDDPIPGTGDPVATGTKGGGEWPDPDTPPSDSAPGSDPARAAGFQAERQGRTSDGSSKADELHPPTRMDGAYGDEAAASGSVGGDDPATDPEADRAYGSGG